MNSTARPSLSIVAAAISTFFVAGTCALGGLLFIAAGFAGRRTTAPPKAIFVVGMLMATALILFSLANVAAGVGMLGLRRWGRTICMLCGGVLVALSTPAVLFNVALLFGGAKTN